MSIRKDKLVNGEIYHICNRGVDKRDIFMDDEDRFRFVHDLFEFNDKNKIKNLGYFMKPNEVGLHYIKKKEPLVEILAFCMMNNHYHLVLRQKVEGGITEFMRKLGTGYTNYFNKKYERTGALFGGKFKSICIKKDAHFMYLPIYVHLNPLDMKFPEWREKKLKNINQAIEFLDSYRWSSYMDYTGQKNFPSLINKEFLLKRIGTEVNSKKEIITWLKNFDPISIDKTSLE